MLVYLTFGRSKVLEEGRKEDKGGEQIPRQLADR